MSELTDLYKEISGCQACILSQGRTHAVPGEGPEDADIMFIGEGPGARERRSAPVPTRGHGSRVSEAVARRSDQR